MGWCNGRRGLAWGCIRRPAYWANMPELRSFPLAMSSRALIKAVGIFGALCDLDSGIPGFNDCEPTPKVSVRATTTHPFVYASPGLFLGLDFSFLTALNCLLIQPRKTSMLPVLSGLVSWTCLS